LREKVLILRGKRNNFRVSKDNKKMENKDEFDSQMQINQTPLLA